MTKNYGIGFRYIMGAHCPEGKKVLAKHNLAIIEEM